MKDLWRHERGGLILAALLIAVVVGWLVVGMKMAVDCEERGGEFIRSANGYICAKVERI